MKNKGSALLIIALAVVILLMVGAALFTTRSRAGSAGPATAVKLGFATSFARAPGGVTATVTITNKGIAGLEEFRVDLVQILGMKPARTLPFMIGKLPAAGSSVVTIPFTGPAPAVNAPLQLELHYDYREGWFARGAGMTSLTAVVP